MSDPSPSEQPVNRDHALVVVLVSATAILLVLCWQLVRPFIAPLAWSLALVVITHPLHCWIARWIKQPGLAAGIAVFLIALVLSIMIIFVGKSIVTEVVTGAQAFQSFLEGGQWREQVARIPWLGPALAAIEQQANLGGQLQAMANDAGETTSQLLAGSAWGLSNSSLHFSRLLPLLRPSPSARGTAVAGAAL